MSRYKLQSPINHSDPWVKQLLERDIDFSKLYQEQKEQTQFLNISPINRYSKSNSQIFYNNKNNIQSKIESSLIKDNNSNEYLPITFSSSQNNFKLIRPTRKWILEQPKNLNSYPIHQNKFHLENYQQPKSSKTNNHKKKKDNLWNLYSKKEKRNILIYIIGIMLYKFGLEAYNGSIVSLATNRYDRDAYSSGNIAKTFEKVGLIIGLNQACQCIGSILISPLIKHYPTRTILSISIFLFSLFTALLMIIDATTGGKIKPSNFIELHEYDYSYYGNYPTNIIIPIYCLTGISYGMVELIRRIIPRDIVGTNENKLQRMDALVHIFYEISGVTGALLTGLILIPRLGNNYAFIITPILFTFASFIWFFINSLGTKTNLSNENLNKKNKNYFKLILKGFYLFIKSVYLGGKIIFSSRKYIWLFPCYSLTLYVHRYIENGLAPQIAKRYLQNSEWSQIIVGGSNFGELCGAIFVFFFAKKIGSPLFWIRIDCLLLLIIWYIPFYNPLIINVKNAWIISLSFIPFGFGSSGNDVLLNAYIQSSLSQPKLKDKQVSSLSSVTSFLYSSYIILYAILNPLLGKYIDHTFNDKQTIRPALIYTAGLQITIISIIVFISTFIPKNSFKLNPSLQK